MLDLLRDDDPRWLSTNEFDDLLANIQALEALIWATTKSPILWKWVIIAAHTTLQSLAICKLTRTDGFGAKRDDIEKKVAAFYAAGKNTLHDNEEFLALSAKENMANFPSLMRRLGYDLPKPEDAHLENSDTNLALFFLHDFRSTYTHYPPVQLTLRASQVRAIVRIAVDVIDLEISKGDWRRFPLITVDEVAPLLDSIRRRFEQIDKG
ncbi:hypothetical protein [Salipiger sp. PrR002]|uniref:hypothetical protein n=1 Tax=Salipiger sp. PrR002 TaxID=2706489 RepID=UPI0013BD9C42|nr:hypothetical protein [Salipiger sp. PrR002]NDW01962.1 hypothetical protein [Salipiger sp. PrR002]NDW58960.1 hypothetical protein [Salipiger sp. PrR004]